MSKPRTGAPKRVAVGLLAGALAMFGVALAPPAGATATVTTERLAGATRYGTAAAIAGNATAFGTPTTAIVATGGNFPDALAASTLAGANTSAPIVLTEPTAYSAEAKAALAALKAKGVTAVTIVGGTSAVSAEVETAIKGDGFTVARVAGDDRYETAAAIAQAAEAKSAAPTVGGLKTAFIATGTNYPDALAAGPGAYANKLPLLLVNDTVPTETSNAIATLGIKKVVILGGTSAVSTAVEGQLVAATGNPATRLAGTNRFSTATAVAEYEIATLAFGATSAVLATGVNFPDALAAGPFGGALKAPIVLTASLPAESQAFLDKYSTRIAKLWVSGGTASIDDATVTAAQTAAQNIANDNPTNTTVTSLPEVVSAQLGATVTAIEVTPSNPAGTRVTYKFDEKILGVTAANFKVYNADATVAATGGSAAISTDGLSVTVVFTAVATATAAANLTVATVIRGAAVDAEGNQNAEGNAAIGVPTSSTTGTAGVTTAPDLASVAGFRTGSTGTTTAVDFVFDQAATVVGATGFSIVRISGGSVDCITSTSTVTPGGGTIAGGSGTTTITAACPNDTTVTTGDTPLTIGTFARGVVATGAVTSAAPASVAAPLEAARINAGTTLTPDVLSVSFAQGTVSAPNDTALYTFDQPVSGTNPSLFCVYTGAGVETCGGSSAAINGSNPSQVLVTFGTTTLDTAVGASIRANAAVAASNSTPSQADEVGVNNAFTASQAPGATAAPDLVSVALSKIVDSFGNAGQYKAVYTFDSSATTALLTATAASFKLYSSAGVQYVGSTCTIGSAAASAGNQVTCATSSTAGLGYGAATDAQIGAAVLGTVLQGAVTSSAGGNPEGAKPTTGGTGVAVNP